MIYNYQLIYQFTYITSTFYFIEATVAIQHTTDRWEHSQQKCFLSVKCLQI